MTTKEYIAEKIPMPSLRICPTYKYTKTYSHRLSYEAQLLSRLGPSGLLSATNNQSILITPFRELHFSSPLPQIDDFFVYCQWKTSEFNCSDEIGFVVNVFSQCFEIFPQKQTRMYSESAGQQFGLRLIIDVLEEENHFISEVPGSLGTGIELALMEPNSSSSELLSLAPGMEYNIVFEYSKHVRLSRPYTEDVCVSRDSYDFSSCLNECAATLHFKNCTCVDGILDFETSACSGLEVSICFEADITTEYKKKCIPQCKRNCETMMYSTGVSANVFPTRNTYQGLQSHYGLNRSFEEARENMMVLNVYPKSMVYTVTQQHRAQTVTSLLANMGGLIGLTLGASMITICEFAEILSVYCIKLVDKLKTSRLKKKQVCDAAVICSNAADTLALQDVN